MTNDDPILSARSVAALMQALDQAYGWQLPMSFPSGTPLGDLWDAPITVQRDPASGVLYLAVGDAPYPIGALLSGIIAAEVPGPANLFVPPPTKEIAS